MPGNIFLMRKDDSLISMNEHEYDSEMVLQELLVKYPELLAGEQINSDNPRQWIFIKKEMGIPNQEGASDKWSLDHLYLDQDAIPTLIEVKRSTDSRIRREVVGQMLDYAANAILYWPVEKLRSNYEIECEKNGSEPIQYLASNFGEDIDYENYWDEVETNLRTGKVRMIFIADEIPNELQTIVEFLNDQMERAEVLAISIKQYVGEGLKTLVPRIVGQTATAKIKKGSIKGKKWGEESFFNDLDKKGTADDFDIAKRIYDWARTKSFRVWFGEGTRNGSFVPTFNYNGVDHQLFAVWSSGTIEIYFYWYKFRKPFDEDENRLTLLNKINKLENIDFADDSINRRPNIPLSLLKSNENLEKLFRIFDWFIDEIKKNN